MKIGSIAASSSGTIDLTYVPQYIYFNAATVPTSFVFAVDGDGVTANLDGTGLGIMKNLRLIGTTSNGYLIQLTDGLIRNKNCHLTIANAVASALDIYGFSLVNNGRQYFNMVQNKALANSGQTYNKFAIMGIPAMGASDFLTATYRDGLTQQLTSVELPVIDTQVQANPVTVIDNVQMQVEQVNYVPTADRSVYVMRYVKASGVTPVVVTQ